MTRVEAVVFDLDGTLLDTSEFIIQAFMHVLERHGFSDRTAEDIYLQVGKSMTDCYEALAPDGDHETMKADHVKFQDSNIELTKAYEHADKTLEALREKGIRTAILTNRGSNISESMKHSGLEPEQFEYIIDGSMLTNVKPDPEGLHKILDRLETEPDKTVMVGDSVVDIEAGKAAGVLATIGMAHGFTPRDRLEEAEADYILDSLASLPKIIEDIENGSQNS